METTLYSGMSVEELEASREQIENELAKRFSDGKEESSFKDFYDIEKDQEIIALAKIFKQHFHEMKTEIDTEITLKISGSIVDAVIVSESEAGVIDITIDHDVYSEPNVNVNIIGIKNQDLKNSILETLTTWVGVLVSSKYYAKKIKELKLILKDQNIIDRIVVLAKDYDANLKDIIDVIYGSLY